MQPSETTISVVYIYFPSTELLIAIYILPGIGFISTAYMQPQK